MFQKILKYRIVIQSSSKFFLEIRIVQKDKLEICKNQKNV